MTWQAKPKGVNRPGVTARPINALQHTRFGGKFPAIPMATAATLNKEQKRHLLLTMLESRHGDLR